MKYRASKVAFLGLFFALSIVLSYVESLLSGMIPVPGIKLGLSNIVTMYCLFGFGKKEAFTLAVLKSGFVLFTRGVVGAAMSLAGGLASVVVMTFLLSLKKVRLSPLTVSIFGGIFHNAGQIIMACFILESTMVFYYFPILAISGIVMGSLTGFLLKLLMPHFNRIFF